MADITLATLTEADKSRFWGNVDKSGDCWIWRGPLNAHGYGMLNHEYKHYRAHRVTLIDASGAAPDGMCALHSCDNPPCVNPAHLRWGTRGDNAADMEVRGRARRVGMTGAINPNARLSDDAVREIRETPHYWGINTELGRRYCVDNSTISKVRKGKAWTNVA